MKLSVEQRNRLLELDGRLFCGDSKSGVNLREPSSEPMIVPMLDARVPTLEQLVDVQRRRIAELEAEVDSHTSYVNGVISKLDTLAATAARLVTTDAERAMLHELARTFTVESDRAVFVSLTQRARDVLGMPAHVIDEPTRAAAESAHVEVVDALRTLAVDANRLCEQLDDASRLLDCRRAVERARGALLKVWALR